MSYLVRVGLGVGAILIVVGVATGFRLQATRAQGSFNVSLFLPLVENATAAPPCTVSSLAPTTTFPPSNGMLAPNGTTVVFGPAGGIYQISTISPTGIRTCISCNPPPPGPAATANKLYPLWHPSGNWIVLIGEIAQHPAYANTTEMLNGWYMTIYLTTPGGSQWWNLTNYTVPTGGVVGALDPHFTPEGTKLVWTKLVGAPDATHQFGYWELHQADFISTGAGAPGITNDTNISPKGGHWFEPEDVTPDSRTVLMTADLNAQAPTYQYGQDIYTLDLSTGHVADLTNTPYAWDEHGHYSPHLAKISWMSSSPYNTSSSTAVTESGLTTEAFIMNLDGSNPQQLTHFNTPGYPEYIGKPTIVSETVWSSDGTQLTLGFYSGSSSPWVVTFSGVCG